MVKKIITILLGALILNGSTEIHQLWKLPFLVKHYINHRNKDPFLSFITFLKIHYTDKDHPNDNDDKNDKELPFKSVSNILHIDTPVLEKRIVATGIFYLLDKPPTFYPQGIPEHRSFSIFHPPRIA